MLPLRTRRPPTDYWPTKMLLPLLGLLWKLGCASVLQRRVALFSMLATYAHLLWLLLLYMLVVHLANAPAEHDGFDPLKALASATQALSKAPCFENLSLRQAQSCKGDTCQCSFCFGVSQLSPRCNSIRSFEKGLADRGGPRIKGWGEETFPIPEIQTSFCTLFLCPP